MIITTTNSIDGKCIVEYKGLVFGEVIAGANFIRDFMASITDVLGGRSRSYESKLNQSRLDALKELEQEARKLGANAIVGVEVNYQSIGSQNSVFMVTATGTAVVIRE